MTPGGAGRYPCRPAPQTVGRTYFGVVGGVAILLGLLLVALLRPIRKLMAAGVH